MAEQASEPLDGLSVVTTDAGALPAAAPVAGSFIAVDAATADATPAADGADVSGQGAARPGTEVHSIGAAAGLGSAAGASAMAVDGEAETPVAASSVDPATTGLAADTSATAPAVFTEGEGATTPVASGAGQAEADAKDASVTADAEARAATSTAVDAHATSEAADVAEDGGSGSAAEANIPADAVAASANEQEAEAAIFAAAEAGEEIRVVVVFDAAKVEADAGADFVLSATSDEEMSPAALDELVVQRAELYDAAKADVLSAPALADDAQVTRKLSNMPVMVMKVASGAALAALRAHPQVKSVRPVRAFKATSDGKNLQYIKQAQAAASGATGAGCSIAVLDTGLDYTNPAFGTCDDGPGADGCRVAYAKDVAVDDGERDDVNLHGTNVAGIIAAVAPAAKVIGLDVFDGDFAYDDDIIAAINWVVANRAKYNICSINLSLGRGRYYSPCPEDPLSQALAALRQAGILAAVSAGNDGFTDSLMAPACSPDVLSVGATYGDDYGYMDQGTCVDSNATPDTPICFANSASFLTMLAPGWEVQAADVVFSGTSQASPHVAGALAVLRSLSPFARPAQVVTWLTRNGVPVANAATGVTTPRLNLNAAVTAVRNARTGDRRTRREAPTGSVSINDGAPVTNNPAVLLTLTAYDVSNVAAVCIREDTAAPCTAWEPYRSSSKPFTLSGDAQGVRTVYVWYRDSNGNAMTAPVKASITLDTVPPALNPIQGFLVKGGVRVSWTPATDATSGVVSYTLVYNPGSTPPAAGCTSGTSVPIIQAGVATVDKLPASSYYSFRLCATDAAGNVSPGVTLVGMTSGRAAASRFA